MYGKIFSSMYDGSLYGQWEAIVTFQQMIVLADAEGFVDMTPQAIAARTSIPLDIIQKGIELLMAPDKYSRTPDCDGRRIELVDESRPWGWSIINHAKYSKIVSAEAKREADRLRIAAKRQLERESTSGLQATGGAGVADCRKASRPVAKVAHEDEDEDVTKKEVPAAPGLDLEAWERWVSYRAEIKKPIKPPSVSAAQKEMAALGSDQMAAVEKSIASGWQGLFAPSGKQKAAPKWV